MNDDFYRLRQKQIIDCWTCLSKKNSKEDFINELEKWKQIQCCIESKNSGCLAGLSNLMLQKICKTCRVVWSDKKYITHHYIYSPSDLSVNSKPLKNNKGPNDYKIIDIVDICPNCDMYINPFLSNPKNEIYVRKYISPKFYKYIIPSENELYIKGLRDGEFFGIENALNDTFNLKNNKSSRTISNETINDNNSYLYGFQEKYFILYNKTYRINDIFIPELKMKQKLMFTKPVSEVETKTKINDDLYISSDSENDESDWLLV
jgi:hypothetical protein